MAGEKFLKNVSGDATETAATQTSAGAPDAGKIPALDGTGRLASTMMPVGVAADTKDVIASEALSAGNFVHVFSNSGTANVRKADATAGTAKPAVGFVIANCSIAGTATVYFVGTNNQVSGAVPGTPVFLSDSAPGGFIQVAPVGAGKICQHVGVAVSSTEINFEKGDLIVLS